MHEELLIGPAAYATGMTVPQLRKLANRRLVEFRRLGQNRLFKAADLPQIRAAGVQAGYVAATEGAALTAAR